MHWMGIDDHADKWTIAHLEGQSEKFANELELVPGDTGHRKLIGFAKGLKGEVRIAYEAGRDLPEIPSVVFRRRSL